MKRDLLPILACPMCKTPLDLTVEAEADGEIATGTLTCTACGEKYSIREGIPDLLPRKRRP